MKQIKIEIPGYVIDQENSDLENGIIKYKKAKQVLTYEEIINKLSGSGIYYTGLGAAPTEEQFESISELNKLANVAKYLNGDWLPDWQDDYSNNYFIYITNNGLRIDADIYSNRGHVYFRLKELACQAIEILGEESIKKALTLNY